MSLVVDTVSKVPLGLTTSVEDTPDTKSEKLWVLTFCSSVRGMIFAKGSKLEGGVGPSLKKSTRADVPVAEPLRVVIIWAFVSVLSWKNCVVAFKMASVLSGE